jgi:ribonucleoside-triphosphate reductase
LSKLLTKGFNNVHGFIRHQYVLVLQTALVAIILQNSQNDIHGGQSFAFFDRDLVPFVKNVDDSEVKQATEALISNLNRMHNSTGAQGPFSSLNFGTEASEEGRKVVPNLLLAYKKGLGPMETPIFKYHFLYKSGINYNQNDPTYNLFQLAVSVSSGRLNPTFSFMDSSFSKEFGDQVSYMGCRPLLCLINVV